MPLSRKLIGLLATFAILIAVSVYLWMFGKPLSPTVNPLKAIDLAKVNRIVMEGRDTSVTLTKKGTDWEVKAASFTDLADPTIPNDILLALRDFKLGSIVSENPAKYAQFWLDSLLAAHTQVFIEGRDAAVLDGYIGKSANAPESSYFRFAASTPVYIADSLPQYQFRREPNGFRWMKLFPTNTGTLKGIHIVSGNIQLDLVRSADLWLDRKSGKMMDAGKISSLVNVLSQWNAESFGHGQESSATLGFIKPYAQFDLESDTGVGTLVIGNPVPRSNPPLRYAQTTGRPAVLMVQEISVKTILDSVKAIK